MEHSAKLDWAVSPRVPPELLEELVGDEDWEVRAFAARNPLVPVKLLEKLAADEHPAVRMAAALNSRLPLDYLVDLITDDKHRGVQLAGLVQYKERVGRGEG